MLVFGIVFTVLEGYFSTGEKPNIGYSEGYKTICDPDHIPKISSNENFLRSFEEGIKEAKKGCGAQE